jgi:hypothetical protein
MSMGWTVRVTDPFADVARVSEVKLQVMYRFVYIHFTGSGYL